MQNLLSQLKVKLFADGADKAGMLNLAANPLIQGMTTNPTLMKKAGISESLKLNQLTRENRETVLQSLFSFPLSITGVFGYQKAEATAGGVNLDEVNSKTLESKLQPGLFFAGEILDVDGRIGGFNFQWAWSSGVVAARGVLLSLRV